jgi:hypothetical protein
MERCSIDEPAVMGGERRLWVGGQRRGSTESKWARIAREGPGWPWKALERDAFLVRSFQDALLNYYYYYYYYSSLGWGSLLLLGVLASLSWEYCIGSSSEIRLLAHQ